MRVKVVETTGKSIKKELVKSNPFKKLGCEKGCMTCEMGVDCKARGVHYRILCEGEGCGEAKYEEETSQSTGERFPEHLNQIRDKREHMRQKSVFYDHAWEWHGGAVPPLRF